MNIKLEKVNESPLNEVERRYQRAQAIMQGLNTQSLVQNDSVRPNWIGQTHCFWYERAHKTGRTYRLVDANTLSNQVAFDHAALAEVLAKASNQTVNAENLPISQISITLSPLTLRFVAFDQHWHFNSESHTCEKIDNDSISAATYNESLSPDGKQIAFARDNNLWVRELSSGKERALTCDGEEFFSYAAAPSYYGVVSGLGLGALWSPDSSRLFVVQRDTRQVKTLPVMDYVPQDGSVRPTIKHVKVAYPGDDNVEEYRLLAIEVSSGRICAANYQRIPASFSNLGFFLSKLGWWANDSQRVYFIDQSRGDQVLHLVEFNTDSGSTRIIFEETSETHINVKPEAMDFPLHMYLPETNELIWWSERSGWGHLFLYDLNTGELKNQITHGKWRVRDILHVDAISRELLIQTAARVPGRNPYYRDLCRIHIDTGELTPLQSTDDEYTVFSQSADLISEKTGHVDRYAGGVAPSGRYIVATRSRADQVPVSLLLDRSGEILLELETTDISDLPEGWQWPEPVKLMAADGVTDIFSILFRPSDFSEDKQYPVINMIVAGPWFAAVPHGSFHNSRGYADRYYFLGAALAELGFMVVLIDSRGTPLRDKAFQDSSYGWIPSGANTVDHRAGLEQLAERYPQYGSQPRRYFQSNRLPGRDTKSAGVPRLL